MNVRVYDVMRCMYIRVCLISMIDVWLGMFDAMLIVGCMLECVCVCEFDISFEYAFNRIKI